MEDDQTDPEMVLLVLMERAFKGPTHEGVRILDWAPQLKRVLKCVRENDPMTMELRGEIERLRADIERHIAIASEHATECERLRAEISTAEAFHKVAVAERNYERQRADILESATIKALEDRDRLRAELAANKRVVDAARAVISNPAYQGICDEDVELEQAVAALAAKEE